MRETERVDVADLQTAADVVFVTRTLRAAAVGSILFGGLAVMAGISMIQEGLSNALLVLLGLFLLLQGIWIRIRPKPFGLVLVGFGLCVVGVWNIISAVSEMPNVSGSGWFFGVFGLLQVLLGLGHIRRHTRFARVSQPSIEPHLIRDVEEIIDDLRKANPKSRQDIITLQTSKGAKIANWKARLAEDCGIFLSLPSGETHFFLREAVRIERKTDRQRGMTVKVTTKVGPKEEMDGTISARHLERFEAWKSGGAANGPPPLPQAMEEEVQGNDEGAAPAQESP